MAENSKIAWTMHTLLPKTLSTFQFADVADAVWFVVAKFMTAMAKRDPICYVIGQLRKISHALNVMRPEISAAVVTAILAGKSVTLKHCGSPFFVFRCAPNRKVPLRFPMTECVMRRSSRRAFAGNCANPRPSFRCVFFSKPVRRAPLCGLAHLASRFGAHFGAFAHG